jgi:tetratricopeptide (TPR) repeat protein
MTENVSEIGPGIVQRKRLRQAIALKNQGQLDNAEKILSALVVAAPSFPEAWLELGNVRLSRSEARLAFDAFARAAGFLETAATAYLALGRLATPGPGDHIRDRNFRRALLVDPCLVPALTDLTDLRGGVVTGWYAAAAVSVERAGDPFQELIKRGKPRPAIRLARIAAMSRPGLPATQRDLAALVFQLEDLESQGKYLERATVLLPTQMDVQIEAVAALFQSEDVDGAERVIHRALKIDPDSALALFWLGRIQRYLGRFVAARATFAAALKNDESFAARIQVVVQGINPEDFTD